MYPSSIRIVGYLGPVWRRSHFSRIFGPNRMGISAAAEFLFCRFRRFREIVYFLSDRQSRALLLLPGACSHPAWRKNRLVWLQQKRPGQNVVCSSDIHKYSRLPPFDTGRLLIACVQLYCALQHYTPTSVHSALGTIHICTAVWAGPNLIGFRQGAQPLFVRQSMRS